MKISKNMSPDSKNNVRNIESGLRKAFTLVELIVVITILAILGTIAFISLQGYSRDARDSKRTSDLSNLKTSLELYNVNTGKLPIPDSYTTITYSGGIDDVWYQGIAGDQVTTNLKQLNEKPLDPLTNSAYTYSVTNSYNEYEVLALYEGNVAYNPITSPQPSPLIGEGVASIFPQANAATTVLTPKIDGNYNGVYVKTKHYIIPVPSIVTSEDIVPGSGKELTTGLIKSLVITNGTNIPKTTVSQTSTGGLSNLKLSVYTGSITKASTSIEKRDVMRLIQATYTGSILVGKEQYKYLLANTSNQSLIKLTDTILLNGYISTNIKTVSDCIDPGEKLYGTLDGTDSGITCSDDIIVCSGAGTGVVIASCNAGATIPYTNQTTFGVAWAGGVYQWGNNTDVRDAPVSSTLVSTANGYQPGEYNSYVFTTSSEYDSWMTPTNHDLWGDVTNTNVARRGPCNEGYHVPTRTDWTNIMNAGGWCSVSCSGNDGQVYKWRDDLHLPFVGLRMGATGAKQYNFDNNGWYWTSTVKNDRSANYSNYYAPTNGNIYYVNGDQGGLSRGYSVRCFKN